MAGMANRLARLRQTLEQKRQELREMEADGTASELEKDLLRAQISELEAEIKRLEAEIEREVDTRITRIDDRGLPPLERTKHDPSQGPPDQMFPDEYREGVEPAPEPEPEPWVTAYEAQQREQRGADPQTKDALARAKEFRVRLDREVEAEKRFDEANRDSSVSQEEKDRLYKEMEQRRRECAEMSENPAHMRQDNQLLFEHSQKQEEKLQEIEPEVKFWRDELQEANSIIEEQNRRLQTLLDQSTDEQRKAYLAKHPITERDIEQDREHSATHSY